MIKFLPSYVGSKAFWVPRLSHLQGRKFVELFCGSAILSANLASKAVLNDLDVKIYQILSHFDNLIVPEEFTKKDYFERRKQEDWWRYVYCLQKMSFSGVFRYSKNGFNVPIKTDDPIHVQPEYQKALSRWKELKPKVFNQNYSSLNHTIEKDSVLILDPPYEKGQASYNTTFDYHLYWEYIRLNECICKNIIIFDHLENFPFPITETRKTRVNGAKPGNQEGMFTFTDQLKEGQRGEELFHSLMPNRLKRLDGKRSDFLLDNKHNIELKSDYYSMVKTPNFFIERFSDTKRKTLGGPWQALPNNDFFVYFFVKEKTAFVFKTKELVSLLDSIIAEYDLVEIPNLTWVTSGFKIPRERLQPICKQVLTFP